MNRSLSVREAKEFIITKIVDEAQREGVSLSEVERKMLYFSETGSTLPDMPEISDEFDRTNDQSEYEQKIARLIRNVDKRTRKESRGEYEAWWSAIRFLKRQDHYILVMIGLASLRPPGDRLRLWATGIVVTILMVGTMSAWRSISDRYNLRDGSFVFFNWAAVLSLVVTYGLLRLFLGAKRVGTTEARVFETLLGLFGRKK